MTAVQTAALPADPVAQPAAGSAAGPPTPIATGPAADRHTGHRLVVRDVIVETDDARSIVFEIPEEDRAAFDYQPGQFLTLRVELPDGTAVARCYSLSSTPGLDDAPKVTVKRIADGRASTWLCEQLAPGMTLDVLPPSGHFVVRDTTRDLLLFAGGSGITPILSILRHALHRSDVRVRLVYANRDERSVIFADELRSLSARFGDRLTVVHLLESVQGLPTAALLRGLAGGIDLAAATSYICGPAPFMAAVESTLHELGMTHDHVVVEKFLSLSGDPFAPETLVTVPVSGETVPLEVELDGQRHELAWPATVTLLDFLRGKGIDAPFSCKEGACSACSCRILKGAVTMRNNQILEAEDLEEGWVLACQADADPTSGPISVTYDE